MSKYRKNQVVIKAVGDGVTDDTTAIQEAINRSHK